jgi:predicted AlkP superfamily pyrophosphatase or phosphodiesterase
MKRALALLLFALSASFAQTKPKLVVIVVVDQFRADYLSRFRSDYTAGFDKMLRNGANFTNARYEQIPTVTAVGHSIVSTGAMPAVSGIVGNQWVDRNLGKAVTAVCDFAFRVVGADTPPEGPRCLDSDPASPNRLLVSTIGDEMRNRDANSRVIGISIKARSAILPSGHRANGAFWFDDQSGNFISSSYYGSELPKWVSDFNAEKLPEKYLDRKWDGFAENFRSEPGRNAYGKLLASPWGNELIAALAEKAITGEQLGQRGSTDLLTVSFSSNDYVGHAKGPDSPEVRDMAMRTDQLLGQLFSLIGSKVGLDKTLVVLTADHGVSPTPKAQSERKMPGDYVHIDIEDLVRSALTKKFGDGDWVSGVVESAVYLNRKTLEKNNVDPAAANRIAADAILNVPQAHASRVYTREQLLGGGLGDFVTSAAVNGFHPARSGDLVIIFEPYEIPGGGTGTTHFAPYNYDSHVPVVFFGAGIKHGVYHRTIAVNDIAPTLAAILDVELPSGAFGKVLPEVVP